MSLHQSTHANKRPLRLLTLGLLVSLLAATLPAAPPATADTTTTGEFRVSNYASGFQNNNYLWRGYAFTVARETVVTHLVGGGGPNCEAGFQGGLYEASNPSAPTLDTLLSGVVFDPTRDTGTPPREESVELDSPVTLHPGQLYFIAQGRVSSGSGCHYAAQSIDVEDLKFGTPIIDQWYPNEDAAFQPSGSGTAEDAVGRTATATTPIRVLMGFKYETDVAPAEFDSEAESALGPPRPSGRNTAELQGSLQNTGATTDGDEVTALYFEYSTHPDLSPSSLQQVKTVEGSVPDEPSFSAEVDGLIPGQTYYYRSVAVNENGRTDGEIRQFTFYAESAEIVHQPASHTAGDGFTNPPTVALTDHADAAIVGRDVTVSLTGADLASGTTTVTTDGAGHASFDDLVIETAGTDYSLTFTAADLEPVTTTTFSIEPGAPSTDPGGTTIEAAPTSVTAGDQADVTVRFRDRFGNPTTGAHTALTLETDRGTFANGLAWIDRSAHPELVEEPAGVFTAGLTLDRAGDATVTARFIDTHIDGSVVVNAAAMSAGPPSAPVATAGDRQVGLDWTAPTDDGRDDIVGYRIETSSDDGATWITSVADTGSATTSSVVDGLTNGTPLRLRVSAINGAGAGAASDATEQVTPRTTPDAPTHLTAIGSNQQVELSWQAPSDDGGAAITGYRIERRAGTTGPWTTVVADTGSTDAHAVVDGLANGTGYGFRLSAINEAGVGASVATIEPETPYTTPRVPTGLSATPGDRQVELRWADPTDDGGAAITGYRIELSRDGDAWTTVVEDTGKATTATIEGLDNGTSHQFRIAARNQAGLGRGASVTATPKTVAGAPTITSIVGGNRTLTVYLTVPDDGGATVTNYQYSTDGGTTWTSRDPAAAQSPLIVRGLDNDVTYPVRVRAINDAGTGAASAQLAATTRLEPVLEPVPRDSAVAPGQARVVIDGQPTPVTTTLVDGSIWRLEGQGFGVDLVGRASDGSALQADSEGRLIVHTGGYVWVSGHGFLPGSTVDVWLFSTPVLLGEVIVDEDGRFEAELALPAGIAPGGHTVQLNGLNSAGQMQTISTGLRVLAAVETPVRAVADDEPAEQAEAVPVVDRLPDTGTNIRDLALLVSLLIGFGMVMVRGGRSACRRSTR